MARAPAAQSEASPRPATLTVAELRCEHAREPLALDVTAPRFSWKLAAADPERRGLLQSAYRLLVASSAAALAAGRGDLWDSGRVESRATVDVPYAGRTLRSFELGHWKVEVWDQDGVPSGWSAPARFGMGVLDPAEWRARWVGFDAPLATTRAVPDLGNAAWIRAAGGARALALERRFEVEGPIDPDAVVVFSAADEYELFLNGTSVLHGSHPGGVRRNAEIARVAEHLVAGTNVLTARVRATGKGPAALLGRLVLDPGATAPRVIATDASWSAAPLAEDDAPPSDPRPEPAVVLASAEEAALGEVEPPAVFLPPPRLLRGAFTAKAEPARATLYAAALGVYSIELNGARAHVDWFAPGWTDYAKRIPYRAYDVTALVRAGENALGVVLADGWYAGMLGKRGQRNLYGSHTRFLGQLVLDHADGTREIVASDASWRAATGPWREADLYMGERYDARDELPGWSAPGFDVRTWAPVDVTDAAGAPLVSHAGAPIRVVEEVTPVAIHELEPGRALFDLGREIAGVARLRVQGSAGAAIRLRFGEALDADGSLWRRNLGWARAADQYLCRGDGAIEIWQPRFTYHGFRYVEVSGLHAPPTPETITGIELSSATAPAGDFRCSDGMVNQLVANVRATLRANSMDVPTDCPQRGERLGWTGDAQLFAPSALWLADLRPLYDKWLVDVADAQRPDGRFAAIAPSGEGVAEGGPGWSDAGVLVPALLHELHGDTRLVERQLESMTRFLEVYQRESGADCSPPAEIPGYGDWHHLGDATPKDVLYLAYHARSARRLAGMLHALGRAEEARALDERVERVKTAFAALCVDAEGRVRGGTQTGYALALRERLVPDALRGAAGRHLVADLEARGGLTTGFLGTPELLPALTEIGRSDLAYRLVLSRAFPSWGHMIEHGATSVWERWDAWTPEHGFANDGRVSLNHTPLGSVVAWLFETAAGIRPTEPGFAGVTLAPVPGGGLAWAEAHHESSRGRIAVRWEVVDGELRLHASLPPNVPGSLTLRGKLDTLRESGRPLGEAAGVRELGRVGDAVLLQLAPGSYVFTLSEPVLAR